MNPSQRQLSGYGWRPADPPRQPVLFVNPRSGDGAAARAGLAERAQEQGIEAVILAPGQALAALAYEAAAGGADALGMAAPAGECPESSPRRARRRGGAPQPAAAVRHPPAALRVRISSRHPGASPSARLRLPGHSRPARQSQG
jgi:hypothetical protein